MTENGFNNNNNNNNNEGIGNKVDNPYFMRFLLYLSLTVIITGVIVGLIFVYQQKVNSEHNQYIITKVNQTLSQVNITKQELYEDQARDEQSIKQNKFEAAGRNNQTKVLLNEIQTLILNHHKQLQSYVNQSNENVKKIKNEITAAQKQNDEIIHTQNYVSMSNNKLLKALANKTGLNVTDILNKK